MCYQHESIVERLVPAAYPRFPTLSPALTPPCYKTVLHTSMDLPMYAPLAIYWQSSC